MQQPTNLPQDTMTGVNEPEAYVLRPAQFGDIWHRSPARSNGQRLALAVLTQAVDDLQKYRHARGRESQRLYRDAYAWVCSNKRTWPYAFLNLCEAVDLSPSVLRAELLSGRGHCYDEAA